MLDIQYFEAMVLFILSEIFLGCFRQEGKFSSCNSIFDKSGNLETSFNDSLKHLKPIRFSFICHNHF